MTATATRNGKHKPSLLKVGEANRQLAEAGESNGRVIFTNGQIVRDAESAAAEKAFNGHGVSAHTAKAADQFAAEFAAKKIGRAKGRNGTAESAEDAEERGPGEKDGLVGEDWQPDDLDFETTDHTEATDTKAEEPKAATGAKKKTKTKREGAEGTEDSSPLPPVKNPLAHASGFQAGIPIDGKEYLETVPIDRIAPSPVNPRSDFDEEYLRDLADSIRANGILQKPLVRTSPNVLAMHQGSPMLELVAGECRWRAAKLAGLTHVAVIRREMTDNQAFAARGVENLRRKDLNPIERAQWAKGMLELKDEAGQFLYTQKSLAEKHGFSQPWIANHLRLLKLPAKLLEHVRSGAMSPSHAQIVLPFVDHKELSKRIEAEATRLISKEPLAFEDREKGLPGLLEWKEIVGDLVDRHAEPLYGQNDGVSWKIEPTESQKQELQLVEYRSQWEGETTGCLNKKLWAKLKQAAIDAARDSQVAKENGGKPTKASSTKPIKKTPAQEKAAAALKAKQYSARLEAFKVDWLRYLVAQEIVDLSAGGTLTKALLYLAAGTCGHSFSASIDFLQQRRQDLCDQLRNAGGKADLWKLLEFASASQIDGALAGMVSHCLWEGEFVDGDEGCPNAMFPPDVVQGLARLLSIDLAAAWKTNKAGPLTERYFELHSKDQLFKLSEELQVYVDANKPKSTMVKIFMGTPFLKLPKELAPPAGSKKTSKQKTAKAAKKKGGGK